MPDESGPILPDAPAIATTALIPHRTGAVTLYEIEDDLLALLDTEDMTEGADRFAILADIVDKTEVARQKRDSYARFVLAVRAAAAAKLEESARLAESAQAVLKRLENTEAHVLRLIDQFAPKPKRGPKKLEGLTYTLACHAKPPAVMIEPGAMLPDNLVNVELYLSGAHAKAALELMPDLAPLARCSPDKTAIKALLKHDQPVEGCSLVSGKKLVIE